MIETWNLTIPELTGDEPRRAYVYLPDALNQDPDARYPVLYMFDGHNLFFDGDATYGKSWGMLEYMDATQTPLIIAAVECNHDPNNGRLNEYSPFSCRDPEMGRIKGLGKVTMDWMVKTFKPEIDRDYPTLPDRKHTFIAGSSMGGLMSLYGVLCHNEVFSRAASFSPTMDVDADALVALIEASSPAPDTVIYMDYGMKEFEYEPWSPANFTRVANALMQKGVILSTRLVPNGDHSEASWERQLPFAIPTIMYGI